MPYITPASIPESATCRTLLIPDSSDWLATFGGALTELIYAYNWEQIEGISVEDTLQVVNQVINKFYEGCAGDCMLPDGSPLFRVNHDGEIEQLVNGEWVPPEGDYLLPPTPARTEPTADERKCLAAANAAAALKQVYEEISDAYNLGMDFQTWTTALTGALITILGTAFGLVIAPLVVIGGLVVGVIYETLEFIGADVWTTEFDDALKCMLYECATDGGDVVHIDMQCFIAKLAAGTDIFDPTAAEIRLFGQLSFILQIIGSQSLDAMGATTSVESADCEECAHFWEAFFDFQIDDGGWDIYIKGSWVPTFGFEGICNADGGGGATPDNMSVGIMKSFTPTVFTDIYLYYQSDLGFGTANQTRMTVDSDTVNLVTAPPAITVPVDGEPTWVRLEWHGERTIGDLIFWNNAAAGGSPCAAGSAANIFAVAFRGEGECPPEFAGYCL